MYNFFSALLLLSHSLIGFYFIFFGFWNIYHWSPMIQVMLNRKLQTVDEEDLLERAREGSRDTLARSGIAREPHTRPRWEYA